MKAVTSVKQYLAIQQFYFHEARLLDSRQYQTWMDLLAPGIEYTMPNRANTGTNIRLKNKEEMLCLQTELSRGIEPPLRDDDFMTLTFRANRPTSATAIADNPLLRTVRLVSNIEAYQQSRKSFQVFNNVSLSYSRHGQDNYQFYFQRRDVLTKIKGEIRLLKREIILDWNIITAPTVALIL